MISIITTTYNYSEYIYEAISSILNQTFKDFEYIIVDDGSTDQTELVIQKFKDLRIRYFKINHIGRAAALNYAIQQSKYEIIALMDADDISHPLRLEKEIEKLKEENQIIFCDSAYFIKKKIVYINNSPKNDSELRAKIILHGHLNNSSVLFYKKFIVENFGYDESLSAYEDYDLWMRVFSKSEFIVIDNPLHFVRLHSKSLTTSNQSRNKVILYSIQEKYFNKLSSLIIVSPEQSVKLRSHREFFYGSKNESRKYLKLLKLQDIDLKILIIFVLSYLPDNFLSFLKNSRIRLRLEYFFKKNIQQEFENVYKNLNQN